MALHPSAVSLAPPGPFVLMKLRPGWSLVGGGLNRGTRRIVPLLPAGGLLAPALPLPAGRGDWPAERELHRFLHLRLSSDADLAPALSLVRGWAFVERAELPQADSPGEADAAARVKLPS